MSHIFVSYSRKDSACVHPVANEMQQSDLPVWIDLESIPITSSWMDEIEKAIKTASVFMLFWSAAASESDYVKYELNVARPLIAAGALKLFVVMRDKTPLPLPHLQGYDMGPDCTSLAVKTLIKNLPREWRKFSSEKSLADQGGVDVGDGFVAVLYAQNKYCKAFIVGKPDARLPKKPASLVVALQFFRPVSEDMLGTVIPSMPADSWILHITGPAAGESYKLDDADPAQWEACRAFIVDTIQKVGNASTTTVHFFTLTPNALFGGITMPFYRFWHIKLYNFVAGKYLPMIDLPRS